MRRRDLITVAVSAVIAWPLPVRAQQPNRLRRVGALMAVAENDPEAQPWIKAFQQGLEKLGWTIGSNLQIDYRWAAGNVERARILANELVALNPDVLLAGNTPTLAAAHEATRTIPIVFVLVSDPIGSGFVSSLARPGGNVTGFITVEPALGGKLVQLLKQIAPTVKRVAFIFNPDTAPYAGYFLRPAEAAASSAGMMLMTSPVQDAADIERSLTLLAAQPATGLIAMPDITTIVHRHLIVALAAEHRLPTVYPYRFFVKDGGLMSYGVDITDQYRSAVAYVDRIFRGANPAELPVQAPTKFELVINLKTAKALDLELSSHLQQLADELIE
jgi:putative tryptophan/tyrosine transport system substrate-binding protein